jgi:hypothetical protein
MHITIVGDRDSGFDMVAKIDGTTRIIGSISTEQMRSETTGRLFTACYSRGDDQWFAPEADNDLDNAGNLAQIRRYTRMAASQLNVCGGCNRITNTGRDCAECEELFSGIEPGRCASCGTTENLNDSVRFPLCDSCEEEVRVMAHAFKRDEMVG